MNKNLNIDTTPKFDKMQVALEIGLYISLHTVANERLIPCTDIINAVSFIMHNHDENEGIFEDDELDCLTSSIVEAYNKGFDQYKETAIGVVDAHLYRLHRLFKRSGIDSNLLRKTALEVREKKIRDKKLRDECYALVGGRDTFVDILNSACQFLGFDSYEQVGDEKYNWPNGMDGDVLYEHLTSKYHNVPWYLEGKQMP